MYKLIDASILFANIIKTVNRLKNIKRLEEKLFNSNLGRMSYFTFIRYKRCELKFFSSVKSVTII